MRYIVHFTGLYSTWLYSQEFRTLFDCGEGAASALQNKVFAVERICISHGHMDHIAGIPNFLWARAAARGDKSKPLTIHYPESVAFLAMKAYTETFVPLLGYEVLWQPVAPGTRVPIHGGKHCLEAFAVDHGGEIACGYRIAQDRVRLKPEFRDRPDIGKILAGLTPQEREAYQEKVPLNLLAYSGDSMPVDPREVEESQCLFFDSTFLDAEDRKAPLHATLAESFELARQARVKCFYALHISPRYETAQVDAAEQRFQAQSPEFAFQIIRPNHIQELS